MKYEWPRNQYRHERAQDLQSERIENGMFRCDRCDLLKPMPPKFEDGKRHCRRCSDPLIPSEAMQRMGEERARNASVLMAMLPFPVTSCFGAAPMITAVSPLSLTVNKGIGGGTIAITGVNLSASDTWGTTYAKATVTPTVNSSTSVTLTAGVVAGAVAGDYSITFNGDVITPRGILKLR